jgi:hypothetical protein
MNLKELERKANKAKRRNKLWLTTEEYNYINVKATIWADMFYYGNQETLIKVINQLIQRKK